MSESKEQVQPEEVVDDLEKEVLATEPSVKTEEELALEAEQAEVDKQNLRMQEFVKGLVDQLFATDLPMHAIDYAPEAFKMLVKIKSGKSKQWSEYLEAKGKAESTYYQIKANELIEVPYVGEGEKVDNSTDNG